MLGRRRFPLSVSGRSCWMQFWPLPLAPLPEATEKLLQRMRSRERERERDECGPTERGPHYASYQRVILGKQIAAIK